MLLQAITLDAAMDVRSTLMRLAVYGLWVDPRHPAAQPRIAVYADRLGLSFEEAAGRLAKSSDLFAAAIRRQWYANILWYWRPIDHVLHQCANIDPAATLLTALNLHEPDSRPAIDLQALAKMPNHEGVILDGDMPVAVSAARPMPAVPRMIGGEPLPGGPAPHGIRGQHIVKRLRVSATFEPDSATSTTTGGVGPSLSAALSAAELIAWPRIDAPDYVPAQKPFEVIVGFSESQQAGVTGSQVNISVPAGAATIDATVELIADGVDATDGWSKPLRVPVDNPTTARATFRLIGRDPSGSEPVHLTTLEVRYVVHGSVCGTASRPLIVGQQAAVAPPPSAPFGTPWLAQPVAASAFTLKADELVADLTIELAKPDRNAAAGRYLCRLYSPHAVNVERGPHEVDLGQDAKTFAKEIVDDIRLYSGNPLVDHALMGFGSLVTERLPQAALDALQEVAKKVAPELPAVLIVSADPYVPWELAVIDPPLDASQPPFLGAQALVGRWLRTDGDKSAGLSVSAPTAASVSVSADKPTSLPPACIDVRNMAVMAGLYKAESGLRKLPKAEEEAKTLAHDYHAIPLAASPQAVKQLLDARLEHNFEVIGGVEVVHFAGHGEFDPARPDSSALFLSDGTPLKSILFRSAKYGGKQQPLIFLNACMIGIGGEILGDMGGFPGNCLRGGFGGVLGALWEVDDSVAHDIAIEFWRRALPTAGKKPEPIGAILRELRARYNADLDPAPETTYLAYVYYGHPRLTLHHLSP